MGQGFVHLHLHSQYSLLESCIRFDDLLERCKKESMPAVAVTDYGNMFGAIEFYLSAKKQGIKPILGCELFIAPDGRFVKTQSRDGVSGGRGPQGGPLFPRIVLLCMNSEGYGNLCKLVSVGYTEGFYYRPRIDYEVLKELNKGLIALSSSAHGDVPATFLKQGPEEALKKIQFYKNVFGDRFYLELQRAAPKNIELESFLIKAGRDLGIKVVATNEPHYMTQDEAFAQETLMCIQAGRTLQEEKRPRLPSDQFYFKSEQEMRELFFDLPEACDATIEIAQRCELDFHFTDEKGHKIYHLPNFPVKEGQTVSAAIKQMASEGLDVRFQEASARGESVPEEQKPNYYKRLDFELSVIDRMGFNGYFLIVQDFINYAKQNDIPVGPGRGSGAGSLVAYSLRITDLDPLKYNLLFERFLNPERISMPDFDVDFCQDRRGEVIDYVTKKYISGSVAQIITFGKLQAKACLRDVGRAMAIPYSEVDFIAKLVPEKLGISLEEAFTIEPKFKELAESDPKIASLLETAQKLEGITRHASIHAAGVIIANKPLVEYGPLYKGNEGETVIQYDMINAEAIGLIKFDFLGLKTLTMISSCIKMVQKNHQDDPVARQLRASSISMSDPCIYELLSVGDTAGVFQFEGDGISDLIKRFKPTCFEDITAINALYRPGPMNMLDEYVARKHGKIKVSYLFPQLEPILKETYGIIVYQEQVQLIASACANYSLGEADILRRAMGKKKPEEMAKQKTRFLEGCKQNALDLKKSEELFDLMAKFAEYGFNKSHAAAYCVVAAQTAYLKAKYPVEFFAALITTEMGDTDKIVKYIKDAREHQIEVLGPSVNSSEYNFTAKGKSLCFGLGGVKGVGEAAVHAILEAREKTKNKSFESVLEFFELVDLRRVNKKVIECLIKGGAFDSLHSNRAELYQGFDRYLEAADVRRRDNEKGQVSLFEMESFGDLGNQVELPALEEWPRSQKLSFEKEVLGFYISDHPLNGLEGLVRNHVTSSISGLANENPKKKVAFAGMVASLREVITKKGSRMAFGQIEDQTGSVEAVIFPEALAKYQTTIKSGRAMIVKGTVERDNDTTKVIAEEFILIENLSQKARDITIKFNTLAIKSEEIEQLKNIIKKHKGDVQGHIEVSFPEIKRQVVLDLDPQWGILPGEGFLHDLEKVFGDRARVIV